MSLTLVEHRDAACRGWSALIDQPVFADQRPRRVELICWTCRQVIELAAWTPATDDPGAHGYDTARDVPAEHRPALAVSTSGTRRYPASVPPERVGRTLVHVEAWLYGRAEDAYQWLATDRDGNVLGLVERTWTDRGALRFRWGTWGDAAGHGDGFHTRDAAVRALVRAVLPAVGGQR